MPNYSLCSRLIAALAIVGVIVVGAGCGSRPAAIVNGNHLTESTLNERLREQYGAATLAGLIDTQIVRDAFAQAGMVLSQEDITQVIETRFGGMERFQELAVQSDLKPEEYIEQVIAPQLMLQKLASRDIQITEEEVQEFYERNRARYDVPERVSFRQILVAQKQDADKAIEALKGGADFASVVTQYSLDPETRQAGGLVSDIPVLALPPQLAEIMGKLKDGEYSAALNLDQLWLIVQLVERKPGEKRTFEQVESQVREDVLRSKLSDRALMDLRAKLRREAKVSIVSPEFQALNEEFRELEVPDFGTQPPTGQMAPPEQPAAPSAE